MLKRYHYTTLWYHESLGAAQGTPFAVIVESERYVYCIGYHLAGGSSVAGQIRKNFHEILKKRVAEASKVARREGGLALDTVLTEFAWNIRAERPQRTWLPSLFGIERFAERMFSKRVSKWKRPSTAAAVVPTRDAGSMKFSFLAAATT